MLLQAAKPSFRIGCCVAECCLPGGPAACSCKTYSVHVQHADKWQAAHSLQTALLQSQVRGGPPQHAPGPVHSPQPQTRQQQGPLQHMTPEAGREPVWLKVKGPLPAWACQVCSMWLTQPAAVFKEWLPSTGAGHLLKTPSNLVWQCAVCLTRPGGTSQVSTSTGGHLQGSGPVVCGPQEKSCNAVASAGAVCKFSLMRSSGWPGSWACGVDCSSKSHAPVITASITRPRKLLLSTELPAAGQIFW